MLFMGDITKLSDKSLLKLWDNVYNMDGKEWLNNGEYEKIEQLCSLEGEVFRELKKRGIE